MENGVGGCGELKFGFVPALLNTKVAIIFAMLYFDRAAAMVKPPSKSVMTGVHMAEKT